MQTMAKLQNKYLRKHRKCRAKRKDYIKINRERKKEREKKDRQRDRKTETKRE